jgi:hypothetical protein
MNPHAVALWCSVPLATGVAIDSLEIIVDRAQLADGGLYAYSVLASARPLTSSGRFAPMFGLLFRYPAVLGLPAVQLLAATMLLTAAAARTPSLIVPAGIAVGMILGARLLLSLRNQLGFDGSDHMTLVVSTGVGTALLVQDRTAQILALDYVAAQLLLSYAVAGIAKAASPSWRSGDALPGILNTIGFGLPAVGAFLERHSVLARTACWSVLVFECSAAPLLLLGKPGALMIIAAGLCFHLATAVLMGLNHFLWSFGAAYPALLLLAHSTETLWH